jgi:hypothetical protein
LCGIDALENGTCATAVPLFKAEEDNMHTKDLNNTFDCAPPLSLDDIELSPDEIMSQHDYLVHTVLQIVVQNGSSDLQGYQKNVMESQPTMPNKIEVHKTDLHPLPAMNINESSTSRNADIIAVIMKELNIQLSKDELVETVKLVAGDQLSIACLHVVAAERAGNEDGATVLCWVLFVPRLFHYKMTATHSIIVTHLSLPNHDQKNPASLHAHNSLLQHKPITFSSLPPFRTCRDLILVSLYACILHCLLLVSGKSSLQEYTKGLTWEKLKEDATHLVDQYTDTDTVHELRKEHRRKGDTHGDMVYENAILFMHDALLFHEFTDAIKCRDSG